MFRTLSGPARPVCETLESRRLLSAGDVDPSFGGGRGEDWAVCDDIDVLVGIEHSIL